MTRESIWEMSDLDKVNMIEALQQEIDQWKKAYTDQHDAQLDCTKKLGKAYTTIERQHQALEEAKYALEGYINKARLLTDYNEKLISPGSSYWSFKAILKDIAEVLPDGSA